jgi:hypothetical protein
MAVEMEIGGCIYRTAFLGDRSAVPLYWYEVTSPIAEHWAR